jgi:hypothetical protein
MSKPTHMKKDKLAFAKEVADALTVATEEALYLAVQAKLRRDAIEWQITEQDIYERAKKYLDQDKQQRTG